MIIVNFSRSSDKEIGMGYIHAFIRMSFAATVCPWAPFHQTDTYLIRPDLGGFIKSQTDPQPHGIIGYRM